jgi:hypothetical protein
MDLLQTNAIEQAAAEAGWKNLSPGIRAIWTTPIEGEGDAPRHRIIHCRLLQLHSRARLQRLGLRPAPGYHKCGSRLQTDWVTAFRLLLWDGKSWRVHRHEQDIPRPGGESPRWFDLTGITASAGIIELRCCEIDRWWTSWNLAEGACILEGDFDGPPLPRKESRLRTGDIDFSGVPSGVAAERRPGEVRFRTSAFEVGFWLGRAGFSHLALDDLATGRTDRNLLRTSPAVALQGMRCSAVGSFPDVAPLLRNDVTGSVNVRGSTVTYSIGVPHAGQEYAIEWSVLRDSLVFRIQRRGEYPVRLWESSAWNMVCDSEITPTCVLGETTRSGETGLVSLPALFHAPGHGTLRIELNNGHAFCRSDSCRPLTLTSFELKVGEIPQPVMVPHRHEVPLSRTAPGPIARAVGRCSITAMTYRPDTGTLTNNGNSIHAPLCMDNWSSVAARIGDLLPGLPAMDLVRHSLERWLDGGPGYGSGGMTGEGEIHFAEDEYIMTGAAALLGLAEYLDQSGSASWLNSFESQVRRQLALMRARDIDNDGLVESIYRHGISGGHQWSTNWYDAVSFGWKDAFANALLYRALRLLAEVLPRLGKPEMAAGLEAWARQLRDSYLPAFFNEATGWLAGWRCRKNLLHDYAFLAVNGAAVCSGVVEGEGALGIIRGLWNEAQRVGMPDPRLGLPGNLWPIPDDDMITLVHGKPMGYYLNGGLSHSQSCRFVGALYRVGMITEGDALLRALCETLADCSAFGGCNSGIDWRYWDGGPCGYEGILTDQFGILAVALDRYGVTGGSARW